MNTEKLQRQYKEECRQYWVTELPIAALATAIIVFGFLLFMKRCVGIQAPLGQSFSWMESAVIIWVITVIIPAAHMYPRNKTSG